jgi:pyrroline-5-carboxylate reductase
MAIGLEIVGGGKMGEALLAGLVRAGWKPGDIAVVEAIAARRDELAATYPAVGVLDQPASADGVILAVKPGDVDRACAAIATAGARRVLSIAAGCTIARIETALAKADSAGPGGRTEIHVVRAMPNTPALVGQGASAIAPGTSADDDDLAWAQSILGAVGQVVRVPEKLLDAVTGLSGSGPAYVFLVAEALIEAGVLVGLPRDTAVALTVQTLLGSAALLADSDDGPEALRAAVTSPGGTTAAGLSALEHAGLRAALLDAVVAATERAHELGTT